MSFTISLHSAGHRKGGHTHVLLGSKRSNKGGVHRMSGLDRWVHCRNVLRERRICAMHKEAINWARSFTTHAQHPYHYPTPRPGMLHHHPLQRSLRSQAGGAPRSGAVRPADAVVGAPAGHQLPLPQVVQQGVHLPTG